MTNSRTEHLDQPLPRRGGVAFFRTELIAVGGDGLPRFHGGPIGGVIRSQSWREVAGDRITVLEFFRERIIGEKTEHAQLVAKDGAHGLRGTVQRLSKWRTFMHRRGETQGVVWMLAVKLFLEGCE